MKLWLLVDTRKMWEIYSIHDNIEEPIEWLQTFANADTHIYNGLWHIYWVELGQAFDLNYVDPDKSFIIRNQQLKEV